MNTRTDILNLVRTLANVPLDDDLLAVYYDDTLEEIGKMPSPPLCDIELFAITSGTGTYDLPARGVKALEVFAGARALSPSDLRDLEAYSDDWRDDTGTPFAFTTTEHSEHTYRLYPEPNASSGTFIPTTGSPLGADYPDNSGAWLMSVKRDTDLPDWIGLYVALRILAKEFMRPSVHRDRYFADQCEKLATLVRQATEVPR